MQRFDHRFFNPYTRPDLLNKTVEEAILALEQEGLEIVQVWVDQTSEVVWASDIPGAFEWRILTKKPHA